MLYRSSGFTVIEILIATFITAMIFTGSVIFLDQIYKIFVRSADVVQIYAHIDELQLQLTNIQDQTLHTHILGTHAVLFETATGGYVLGLVDTAATSSIPLSFQIGTSSLYKETYVAIVPVSKHLSDTLKIDPTFLVSIPVYPASLTKIHAVELTPTVYQSGKLLELTYKVFPGVVPGGLGRSRDDVGGGAESISLMFSYASF